MKVYYHHNPGGFSNCYIVVNEAVKEAIIIDPGKVSDEIISQIEDNELTISGILITHNHGSHVHGLTTLRKIYSPKIYAADWEVAKDDTTVISRDGSVKIAKLTVDYMTVPGHTSDSIVYKIENLLFTGDVLGAGTIGSTNSSYSKFILESNIRNKIFSMDERMVILPGHGPLSTLGALKEVMKDSL
ncbi:MAG: MBL fold metallo-hydrolase [Treponema sp.]|nr:MBL fold metallo-hydrolase [Treponema sp.]